MTSAESDVGDSDEENKDDDATEWPETDHGRCPWAGTQGGPWRNDENEREDRNTRKMLQAKSTASAKVLRQEQARSTILRDIRCQISHFVCIFPEKVHSF